MSFKLIIVKNHISGLSTNKQTRNSQINQVINYKHYVTMKAVYKTLMVFTLVEHFAQVSAMWRSIASRGDEHAGLADALDDAFMPPGLREVGAQNYKNSSHCRETKSRYQIVFLQNSLVKSSRFSNRL